MNILVTGANGQLGNEMRILTKNSADKYIFTDVVDSSDESIAMLKKLAGSDINTEAKHLDITKLDAIREIVKLTCGKRYGLVLYCNNILKTIYIEGEFTRLHISWEVAKKS